MKKIKKVYLLIITLMITFAFAPVVKADGCDGYDSNHCRITANRTIISAGGNISQLRSATQTRKAAVSTNGRYSSKGGPVNFYRDIGINYVYNGSSITNGYYSSYYDSYSALYCLDAQYEGYNPLYAERFLLDSSHGLKVKAFDVAVMSVLVDNGILGTPSASNITDYWARLVAIRGLLYTFGLYNTAGVDYRGAFYANLTAVNSWLNENSGPYDSLNSALSAAGGGSLASRSTFSAHTSSYFGTNSGSAMATAKNYYFSALNKSLEYVNSVSNGEMKFDTTSVLPEVGEVEEEETRDGVLVKKDIVHTIVVSGMSQGKNSFIINGLNFANDEVPEGLDAYISSIEIGDIKIEGRSTIETILGQDFLAEGSSFDFTNETEIKITVHLEGYESSDNKAIEILKCGQMPIKYSIDGTYKTNEFGEYSKYVATIWYSGESQAQRYIGVEPANPNDGGSPWSIEYETYLIDACDCDDLIEACKETGSMSSDECQELLEADCGECAELEVECEFGDQDACNEYGAVCEVECPTTVDNFNCCDANNNLVISPLDNWEVNIKGPEGDDIYACFVSQIDGQVDLQGEGVGAETVGGAVDDVGNDYTLDQNRYCVISCKEDYYMEMPTAKLVNAGRYFTFKASIDGEKTCYTNTIDRDLYNEDIIEKQKELTDAYNEYRKWYELYHNGNITPVSGSYPSSCSCNSHGCGPSCSSSSYYPNWRATATVDDWQTVTGEDPDTGRISRNEGANGVSATYVYEETIGAQTYSCPGGSWTTTSCSGTGENRTCHTNHHSCSGGSSTYYTGTRVVHTEADFRNYLRSQMNAAEKKLNEAQEAFENVIKEYNKCSEWETELQYDEENPHVYYDYEESYLDDFYNGYGEMTEVISNKNTSEWYCNSSVSSNGSENQAQLSSSGSSGINYESCSLRTPSSSKYTGVYYTYCTVNSCKEETRDISDARYKKVTSSVEADYVPATLFYNIYPSGEITDESADNNVALENSLPVSLNTKRGIYKYTVNIDSLGEFYENGSAFDNPSNGEPGRLIASNRDDNSVINKDDYGEFVDENGTVQYACSYLVNMGITDGDTIVCDFDTECTGDDCIADCIGPNCDYECDGDDCIADCIGAGCIYDSDAGTSLIERVVSLSNLFPDGTNSYNWNRDANDKAATTIDEIQDAGNAIYEEEPIFSVTITPSVARAIKQYNDDAEAHGGYSNSTLSCYALDGYEEIACYSSFITGLLEGRVEYDGVDYINNIDVVNDRSLIMGNNYRTVRDDNTEYFTTWSGGISEEDMIGPSWK